MDKTNQQTITPSKLWVFPTFYFLYYAGLVFFGPFFNLYLDSIGLSSTEIGIVQSIAPWVPIFAAPLWGLVSDWLQQRRWMLFIAMSSGTPIVVLMLLTQNVAALAALSALSRFFFTPVLPLITAIALTALGDRHTRYGRWRMWGALGWGVLAPFSGWIAGAFNYQTIFYIYIGFVLVCAVLVLRIPDIKVEYEGGFKQNVWQLLKQRSLLVFVISVFVVGLGVAVRNNYFSLYLVQQGGAQWLVGLGLTFGTLTEMPIMFFSSWFLERFGERKLLLAAFFFYALRLLLISQVTNPWGLLFVQLLNGPTFGFLWIAGVAYARAHAPQGLGATAQSLFSTTFMSLAGSIGAVAGGWYADLHGYANAFLVSSGLVVVGLLLFFWFGRERRDAAVPIPAGGEPVA